MKAVEVMARKELVVSHEVAANGVYTLDGARQALGLAKATMRREVRLGRLRVSKPAGRY